MPLTLVPDFPTQTVNGKYGFYSYQLVTLTATLDDPEADISAGTLVYFANVGDGVGLELQPQGSNWVPAKPPHDHDTVGVALSKVADHKWQAQLVVLVTGAVPGSGTTYAYIDGDTDYQSSVLAFTVSATSFVCPNYVDGFGLTYAEADQSSDFWLSYAEQDQSPDNPGNNYLYYRFQVTDPNSHVGLRNICVRVSSSQHTPDVIKYVLLYDRYSGTQALTPSYDPINHIYYVDLETDENGLAELYLCPKRKTSSVGELVYQIGANQGGLGPYLIIDPTVQWPTVGAPQTDNPVQLSGSPVAFAQIPQYENIAAGQWLFLLCNGRFQSSKMLKPDDIGAAADIMMPFQKSSLRSYTAPYNDATQNSMIYVVGDANIRVSSDWNFNAAGTPPSASPDYEGNSTLSAPQLCESPDGWPISAALLTKELHIRVPLDQPQITCGDEIRLHVYLNAYRRGSDEPLGIGLGGPFNWKITQLDIANGFVEWPFLPQPFWGFGQAQLTGDVGTMRVNYDVARGTTFALKRIVYSSQDLLLGIDTILPNGYTAEVF